MKTLLLALTMGSALTLTVSRVQAEVNCEQVRRYLKTGRSAEDIADTMVVDIKDIKKCQEAAPKDAPPTPAAPQEKK